MSLIEGLHEPVIREMTDTQMECERIEKLQNKAEKRLKHIEAVVLKQDGKLDIFDEQNKKIMDLDVKVRELGHDLLQRT